MCPPSVFRQKEIFVCVHCSKPVKRARAVPGLFILMGRGNEVNHRGTEDTEGAQRFKSSV